MSLGSEIVSVALGYARARLEELRGGALADVEAFAGSLGIAGFVDAGGEVADHLSAAKDALSQAETDLGNGSVIGAAGQLGTAVSRLDQAARKVAGVAPAATSPLLGLLGDAIDWASVAPKGLAAQLGLPATVPGLALADGALSYSLAAPSQTLSPAPALKLEYDKTTLTAKLRVDGQVPLFSLLVAFDQLEAGIGADPLSSLLGGAAGSAVADVGIGVDSTRGLTLSGSASPRIVLPARTGVGPFDLRELALELPAGEPAIALGGTFTVELGPIKATVDGAGIKAVINEGAIEAGANPLSVAPKPPTGIGLSLDAGIIRGGGFLGVRPGGYGGALQLRLGPVDVKAVGLLTLDPDFALVVVMSVEFNPAIDLSFGFTLNAVGGVIGIEHRLDTDALRAKLSDGALDHLMFPDDPVGAAPAILDTLATIFPVQQGSIVIGPMVEIGWGRPISFLLAQVGVLISLPDPKIVIIGRVRIALPAPELPIVDLRASVYGEITPDYLLVLVSLRGSRIAGFSVGGDIGMLIKWGGGAEFAISAGGFHPRYTPPKQLAGMQRLNIDLSPPAILELRAVAYFAVTSNSVQLGARVELGADLGVASISGYLSFDALIVFAPKFLFMIDLGIGLTVRAFGVTLCGVDIQLHLEGPGPWRAEGTAEVEILWWDVEIDVGPFTWGEDDNPPPPPAEPRELVWLALHHNPGSWQALMPPNADQTVRLRAAEPSDTEVTVHPLGLFEVRQHAVPLETVVVRVGPNPVPEGQRRVHLGPPTANGAATGPLNTISDQFAPGGFLDLTDDEKLSRPGFEAMPSGVRSRPAGESVPHTESRQAVLTYETFVGDPAPAIWRIRSRVDARNTFVAATAALGLQAGAAGRSELRARTRYATEPDPIVLADSGESVVRSTATLAATGSFVSYTAAAETISVGQQITRLGVG